MRLLQVISSADPRTGGAIEGLTQQSLELIRLGHTVEVLTADDPRGPFLAAAKLNIHAVGPRQGSIWYAKGLQKWLEENVVDYDGVILNGLWQYPCYIASRICRKKKVPYWIYTHGMLDPWFNKAFPLKKLKKQIMWPLQHAVLSQARSVLFTCEQERLLARESFRPYRVTESVVPYGTGTPPDDDGRQVASFRAQFPQLNDTPFLIFLGRVHPKKGVHDLVKAVKIAADQGNPVHVALAGPVDDEYRKTLLESMAAEGVTDRFTWLGMLQGDVKWGAFRLAEAFILPSYQENFGVAVVEALACRTPVLISTSVNIWREVVDANCGLAEDPGIDGTVKLLTRWGSLSTEEKQRMREVAQAAFHARFTSEISASSLLSTIQSQL